MRLTCLPISWASVRALGILKRQQHGKNLSAGAEDRALLADAAGNGLGDAAQGSVALARAVKLVVELEVVHVKVEQRQAFAAVGVELLVELLGKVAVVVSARQRVDTSLAVHFFIEHRVLHGDGRDRADGFDEACLRRVKVAVMILGREQHQPHDILPVAHGGDAVNVEPAEQVLFRLPLLVQARDQGAVLRDGEGARRERTGAAAGLINTALQRADVSLFCGYLAADDLAHSAYDVRRVEGLVDLPGELLDEEVALPFAREETVQQAAGDPVAAAEQR